MVLRELSHYLLRTSGIPGCNLLSCLLCVVVFFLLLIFQVTSFETVKASVFIQPLGNGFLSGTKELER